MPPRAPSSRPLNLQPERRLRYSYQYRRFFDGSEAFRLSQCTFFRIQNDVGHFRLGITLKARGSSVERNGVKRAIRENFRQHAPQLGGFDYNVVVPASKRISYAYRNLLTGCLQQELSRAVSRHK